MNTQLSKYLLRLAGIVPESYVDGPGVRYTVFFQGCPHHCKGCRNSQTWDFFGGTLCSVAELLDNIASAKKDNPCLEGVTFSGGEPFCQTHSLVFLAREIKKLHLNLVVFTGYYLEQLVKLPYALEMLNYVDLLIDGPFLQDKKSLALAFRGSSNQHLYPQKDIQDFLTSLKLESLNK